MEKKKIVFISLPMNGLTPEEILSNIESAKEEYLKRFNLKSDDIWFVENFFPELNFDTAFGHVNGCVYYLGRALQRMAKVDEVFFYGDWKNARGCQIEHEVCERYRIPYVEV